MKKHLYNARLSKVRWFIQRFGWREIALKPLRTALAPLIIPTLRPASFQYHGQSLPYFYHRYNMTWASERCVEVPIARWWASQLPPIDTLEIGNVLSHYGPVAHDILDKFEKAPGVINNDILAFKPTRRYNLILSISTFEHIGFDDAAEGSSAEKILAAIRASQSLLTPDGKLVVTIPIGYNPDLDRLIATNQLTPGPKDFLARTGHTEWTPTDQTSALKARYKSPFPYANAIMVAEFNNAH